MATTPLDSLNAVIPNAQNARGGNGCLVCRLRSKRCLGAENGRSCMPCLKLRIECVEKHGSISSSMENSAEGQACRDEIHSAINSRRSRRNIAPLHLTKAFAARLVMHHPLLPPHPPPAINMLEEDLKFVIDYERGSYPQCDPSVLPFTLHSSTDSWSAYLDDPGSSQSSSFPAPTWAPQGEANEGSDLVLFPYTASPKGISPSIDSQPNPAATPFFSLVPPYSHPHCRDITRPRGNERDLHTHSTGTPTSEMGSQVFIESMRVLLRSYGYEIVPLS